jgi:signal transduction histidine kinase/ligand-binding sensor domain-containing protein
MTSRMRMWNLAHRRGILSPDRMIGWGSRRLAWVALALLLIPLCPAPAATPVIRLFTTEDGLLRNYVSRIRPDRAGRLWFCTGEGLSMFDGERFTNYTVADGLPHPYVSDFLDPGDGAYWIVTGAGLFRFRTRRGPAPSSAPSFEGIPLERKSSSTQDPTRRAAPVGGKPPLFQSRSGEIWVGTPAGLYRIENRDGAPRGVLVPLLTGGERSDVRAIVEDRNGNLWLAAGLRLVRRRSDGRVSSWGPDIGIPSFVRVLMQDRDGRLWVGFSGGLSVLDVSGDEPSVVARYSAAAIPTLDPQSLFEDASGDLWVGADGLARLESAGRKPGARWLMFDSASLLGSQDIDSITADPEGNLWMAGNLGVVRILRKGFTTFTEADGLESKLIYSVFETGGKLYAITGIRRPSGWRKVLSEFDGQRFTTISPRLPDRIKSFGEVALRDRRGEWWIATLDGLVRYPRVISAAELTHTAPKAKYGPANGLPFLFVLRLFEEREGGIWVSGRGVARWDPVTDVFQDFGPALRDAIGRDPMPLAFAQDRAGDIWIGASGALVRFRAEHFERIHDGVPAGDIASLLVDHAGRLWIASSQGGLGCIDDPSAPSPRARRYSNTEGLASNHLFSLAEDHPGRLYVAGGHGVDRLDPASGFVEHFLPSDGLPPGENMRLYGARDGAIWFASSFGLSRYEPDEAPPAPAAAPVIHSVRVAGVPTMLSDEGETSVGGLDLSAGNEIEIAYGSVNFSVGHSPKYQYRLLPDAEWRKPTALRTAQYARLGPARYTFEVRGINSAGMASEQIASVAFRIPPPLWQRWWFLMAAATTLAAVVYAAHAYRLRQVLAVQRIRTGLATDLHDDLGSGLAEIAIICEVARQDARPKEAEAMETVAERARELRAAMGDIVWSVDPTRDNLTDVIRRWRQAAASLLGSVSLAFVAPPETQTDGIGIPADGRRHLLLLFKEAITNVARHARATHVWIEVSLSGGQLHLRIRDDGCGFCPAAVHSGNGLRSLKHRTEQLKGKIEIDSTPGAGATLDVAIPVPDSRRLHVHAVDRRRPLP